MVPVYANLALHLIVLSIAVSGQDIEVDLPFVLPIVVSKKKLIVNTYFLQDMHGVAEVEK